MNAIAVRRVCADTRVSRVELVGGIVGAAALFTVACPPYEWAFAAWVVPGLLLVTTRGLRPLAAFFTGAAFGSLIGWGVSGWMPGALLDYFAADARWAWGTACAAWLLYVGIPNGLLTLAYSLAVPRVPAAARAPIGAWLWVASEWLRATMLTGMPWELLGHSQFGQLQLIQVADLGGVYAVSFVVALISIAVAELVADGCAGRWLGRAAVAKRLAWPAALLAAVLVYGATVASRWDRQAAGARMRTVAVVQGNVPNAFRWKRAYFERALATYVGLTMGVPNRPDLIVWPENAVNFYLEREPALRAPLAAVAGQSRDGLLVGGPRLNGTAAAHNSAYLIDARGGVAGVYDKRRLVPFAEYDPLPSVGTMQNGSTDVVYMPGTSDAPVRAGNANLGTLICYEVLFPALARSLVRNGADVLINLSNDSWLDRGDGAAPRQHFSMAGFRAVETRRYLVRAASSGVSGFINPYGRPYATLPVDAAGATVATIELQDSLTPYVRYGDAWLGIGAIGAALTLRRRRDGAVA